MDGQYKEAIMQNYHRTQQQWTNPPVLGQAVLAGQPATANSRPNSTFNAPTASRWQTLLARFDPISLSQMNGVALLNRTDTKFVLDESQLHRALAALQQQYRVLDISGIRLNHYQTLYFDTGDFALYRRHHAGGHNRYKVRSREYLDSHLSFLEIKHKVDSHRTIKNRMQTPDMVTDITSETDDFMDAYFPLDPEALEPKLWNDFYRITLVSKQQQERLTLDLNLNFGADNRQMSLPGVAIAEVKQAGINRNSVFMQQMRAMRVRPTGFSKYCIGVSLLHPGVKHNNFKPKLQLINKLMKGTNHVDRIH